MSEPVDEFPDMPNVVCTSCGETKKKMHFNRGHLAKHGKTGICRLCAAERNGQLRVGNPVPAASLGNVDGMPPAPQPKGRMVRGK